MYQPRLWSKRKKISFRCDFHEYDRAEALLKKLGWGWDWSRLCRESLRAFIAAEESKEAALVEKIQVSRRKGKKKEVKA